MDGRSYTRLKASRRDIVKVVMANMSSRCVNFMLPVLKLESTQSFAILSIEIIACSSSNVDRIIIQIRREGDRARRDRRSDERANEFVFYNFPTRTNDDDGGMGVPARGKIDTYTG
ncbi:hypothetical protein ACS0PU_011038 [Formica fusca]